MSLDISIFETRRVDVCGMNITHNLGRMADEAGLYAALWRPSENDITIADDLIPILEDGIQAMKDEPEHFKKFDAKNGWGTYDNFLPWLEELLLKCKEFPAGLVEADV